MNKKNFKIFIIIISFVVFAFVNINNIPAFIHYFDNNSAIVSVTEILQTKQKTSNLTVE